MYMDWYSIFQAILNNLGVPILLALGTGIGVLVTKWTEKIGKSIMIKNEIDGIETRTKTRKEILESLAPVVESAVASNMDMARKMKEATGYLSEEQIAQLNESACQLIMNTLPDSLTKPDGVLLDIVGGEEQLKASIKLMIERYVYEYKNKYKTGKQYKVKPKEMVDNTIINPVILEPTSSVEQPVIDNMEPINTNDVVDNPNDDPFPFINYPDNVGRG